MAMFIMICTCSAFDRALDSWLVTDRKMAKSSSLVNSGESFWLLSLLGSNTKSSSLRLISDSPIGFRRLRGGSLDVDSLDHGVACETGRWGKLKSSSWGACWKATLFLSLTALLFMVGRWAMYSSRFGHFE